MGHTPIGPPRRSTDAELRAKMDRRRKAGRRRWRPGARREAHALCLILIERREIDLGWRKGPQPPPKPAKPADPTYLGGVLHAYGAPRDPGKPSRR